MPIRDIRDVESMARLDADARQKLEVPERIADAFIGEVFAFSDSANALDNAISSLVIHAERALNRDQAALELLIDRTRSALEIGLPVGKDSRRTLHWPLEFPEVFYREDPGFDALIGNPPFIGGRRMRGTLGDVFLNWLACRWPHASMNADFCVFFYLEAVQLLRSEGSFGFLGTKTIAQGDTARTGLGYLIQKRGVVIRFALSSFEWPGSAAVVAALVVAQKGTWAGVRVLDGNVVPVISEILDDQGGWGEAVCLSKNINRSFQGSVLVGLGFVLTQEEAQRYLKERRENIEVIKPYLSGDDLNSHPQQLASRWAIDFRDASLSACEERWPELMARVRELVKPQRDVTRREAHRRYWWHHGDKRPALYSCIEGKQEVFVIARVTKYVAIVSVPAHQVFHDKVYVFDLPGWASFAALQSSFHDIWVRRGSSTVGETLNYTPSDYFNTYPFLHIDDARVADAGRRYHVLRKLIMAEQNKGLTEIYNQLHDESNVNPRIQELRDLQVEMDRLVADAYGWDDLILDHRFYQTKQGIRLSISEHARRAALQRLLKLNRDLFDEESANGAHDGTSKRSVGKLRKPPVEADIRPQPSFDFGDTLANRGKQHIAAVSRSYFDAAPADAILEFLMSRAGWYGRAEILAATSIQDREWNSAINDLIASGDVEREGEKRGARYRAATEGAKE